MHVFKTHFNSIFLLNLLDTHKYQDFDFFQRCHRKFNVRGYFFGNRSLSFILLISMKFINKL